MTTQTTMYEEFDSTTHNGAVLLQFPGDLDRDGMLPPPDPVAGQLGRGRASLVSDARRHDSSSQYKGGSDQWFVTYELGPETSDDGSCPQVTRVYLSGELCSWELGTFATHSGAVVYGVKIEYQRTHESYRPNDGDGEYEAAANTRRFVKIIEVPPGATHVQLRCSLPDRYRHALHRM